MLPDQGIHHIPAFDVDRNARELVHNGWRVFVLPGGINDKKKLFDAIRSALPLDPPVFGDRSWEALSDSLWGGLDSLNAKKIAIIWPASEEMAMTQPEEFKIASSILSDLTKSLADADATIGDVKQILVVLG